MFAKERHFWYNLTYGRSNISVTSIHSVLFIKFFMEHFEISLAVSKIEYRDRAGRKRAWKIGLPTTCYRKHYTLDASCISSHYVHSVQFCPRKFSYKNPRSTRNITIFCYLFSVSSMRRSIFNVCSLIPRDTDATVFIADCLLC